MGQEAFIPFQLSHDHLPYSMRYYDPIIHIAELEISDDKKEYFYEKNKINMANFLKYNVKQKLEERIFGPENGGGKLTFKHAVVNEKEYNQINHHESEHTPQVQRSQYLMIDNNVETER